MHAQSIVVQDLKPANILLDEQGELYIADFGLASIITSTLGVGSTTAGTPNYKAPEQYDNSVQVSRQTDMWALGCVVVEMLTGFPPWRGMQPLHIMMDVCGKQQSPQIPTEASGVLATLLRSCFRHSQSERMTAREALATIQSR